MRTKFYAICALILVGFAVQAQDIHFSQYYASPLTLNPALTGKFDGLYRITGIYRGQYYGMSQSNSIFRTPSISLDFSLFKEKMKGNALGLGLVFVNDEQNSSGAGSTGKIATNTIALNVSYILNLDKKKTTQISLGLQPTLNFKKNTGTYEFPDAFRTDLSYNEASPANEHPDQASKMYFNFDFGIFFNTHPLEWLTFYAGYQMANIARPDVHTVTPIGSTYKTDGNKIPFRHMIHGGFEFQLKPKWVLIPGFLYQNMAKANEANAGVTVGYTVVDKSTNGKRNKATLFLGLWNRMGNDVGSSFQYRNITPKLGFDYNNIRIGFAYDISMGNIASDAKSVPGIYRPQAYELSVSFIGLGSKPLKDKDWMFSPRF